VDVRRSRATSSTPPKTSGIIREVADLAALSSCMELTTQHAKHAASGSAEIRALLKRVSEIARPDEGCPKVLMAIARLVGQDWVEGDLRVELAGDESHTTLTVLCEHGAGIRERLLPVTRFEVPFDEFSRALELSPALALPLRISDEGGKIILTPLLTPEDRIRSAPPPAFEVDPRSLAEGQRRTPLVEHDAAAADAEALGVSPPRFSDADELEALLEQSELPLVTGGPSQRPDRGEREATNGVHTRPTVPRMVAVDVPAVGRRDPRAEDDDG